MQSRTEEKETSSLSTKNKATFSPPFGGMVNAPQGFGGMYELYNGGNAGMYSSLYPYALGASIGMGVPNANLGLHSGISNFGLPFTPMTMSNMLGAFRPNAYGPVIGNPFASNYGTNIHNMGTSFGLSPAYSAVSGYPYI